MVRCTATSLGGFRDFPNPRSIEVQDGGEVAIAILELSCRHLGFPKYDVDVGPGTLEDVWLADNKQDVLGFADGDPGDAVYLPETQLGHGLRRGERR